ncbi:MAG: hypothetical protein M0R17_06325 [Candidatus Omnitrophica bacterium]|jgi:hypothetical protein|nr:hypothetical protein [Candidatus Omnitrophota bacterium]
MKNMENYSLNTLKQERLKIYKKALHDYRISLFFPFKKIKLHTNKGLCAYFFYNNYMNVPDNLEITFPELYEFRPCNFTYIWLVDIDYWFSKGKIIPRIKVLKATIKLTKKLIKDEKNKTA